MVRQLFNLTCSTDTVQKLQEGTVKDKVKLQLLTIINPVKKEDSDDEFANAFSNAGSPVVSFELTPIRSTFDAGFEEQMEEAKRQSKEDQNLSKTVDATTNDRTPCPEPLNGEEDEARVMMDSVNKVMLWDDGGEMESLASGVNIKEKIDPPANMIDIQEKKNADEAPPNSILAFAGKQKDSPVKTKGKKKSLINDEPVTRVPNVEEGTMKVSSIKRKRQGRGNQHSYYDITSELHYLRH